MSELSILSHLEPIESGETQICSEGIRVSSYETVDGVSFTTHSALQQSLEYKRAFDESWAGINEPELKDEPEIKPPAPVFVASINPAVQPAVPVAVQVKQPESALEEHTADQSEDEEPNRLDDLAAYVKHRSARSEKTQNSAQESVEPRLPDSQSDDLCQLEAFEPVSEVLATSEGVTDSVKTASEPLDFSGYFDPLSEPELTDEVLGTLEPVRSLQLSVTDQETSILEPVLTPYQSEAIRRRIEDQNQPKPKRKYDPWKVYRSKSKSEPKPESAEPELELAVRPSRARDFRQTPFHKQAISIPTYVREAKIEEQGGQCIYCDRLFGSPILRYETVEILEAEPEHFQPRAAKGRTVDSNLDYACHVCNKLKSDYLFQTREEVREFLADEWTRKGYRDCPSLIPFKHDQELRLNGVSLTRMQAQHKCN